MKVSTPEEVAKRLVPGWEAKRVALLELCAQALAVTGELGAVVAIPRDTPQWVVEMVVRELRGLGWEASRKLGGEFSGPGQVQIRGKVPLDAGQDDDW